MAVANEKRGCALLMIGNRTNGIKAQRKENRLRLFENFMIL
jgi:hypothetical protein